MDNGYDKLRERLEEIQAECEALAAQVEKLSVEARLKDRLIKNSRRELMQVERHVRRELPELVRRDLPSDLVEAAGIPRLLAYLKEKIDELFRRLRSGNGDQ